MSNTRPNQLEEANPIFLKPPALKRCDDHDLNARLRSGLAFFSTPRTRINSPTRVLFNENLTTDSATHIGDPHVMRIILSLASIDRTETLYLDDRNKNSRKRSRS